MQIKRPCRGNKMLFIIRINDLNQEHFVMNIKINHRVLLPVK